MQAVLGCQKGGHDLRCSMRREWKLGMRIYYVLTLLKQRNMGHSALNCRLH